MKCQLQVTSYEIQDTGYEQRDSGYEIVLAAADDSTVHHLIVRYIPMIVRYTPMIVRYTPMIVRYNPMIIWCRPAQYIDRIQLIIRGVH
jgi:hypothetical protein